MTPVVFLSELSADEVQWKKAATSIGDYLAVNWAERRVQVPQIQN